MNDSLFEFIHDVYNNTNKMALTNDEIKNIEKFYKENYKDITSFEEFMNIDRDISRNIKKVKGVYAEVERKFNDKEALQPGTLVECVLAQTIANMYNLTNFVDAFHSYIRELPANVLPYLRSEENTLLCRYIYYDPNNYDNFLIQYGNPTSYDADLFLNSQSVKLEFKDRVARAGERDIRSYDENGKLIIDEKFAEENPDYIPFIEKFNEETDIFSRYLTDNNVNYNDFDEETRNELLKNYFNSLGIDSLVSFDENGEMIAITIDCIDEVPDFKIVSTDNSEIRPAGKNPGKVFTPEYLKRTIASLNGTIENNIVKISKDELKDRVGRGRGGEVTGKKISNLLMVKLENIQEKGDMLIFNIEDIQQLKPTISIHVKIIASKEQLREYYYDMIEKYEQDKNN